MKTSIALIVVETRRTVGRLARGAAAQARRVLASGGDLRSVTQTSATIYPAILERFFQVHDPTTYEQQGSDFGPSYRSAIFYTDEQQKETALTTIAEIEASGLWPGPVVTEINPEEPFWQAEPEHQNYLQRHPRGYSCHFVRPNSRLPWAHTFRRPATAEGPKD